MVYKRECPVCGAMFETEHSTKKYCSHQCYLHSKHGKKDVVTHRTNIGPGTAGNKRRCHDCGRPTTDYRCERCWSKIRKGYDL